MKFRGFALIGLFLFQEDGIAIFQRDMIIGLKMALFHAGASTVIKP